MSIPKTLINFKQYQEEYYDRLLTYPHMDVVTTVIELFFKEIIKEGAFYLRVKNQDLPAIVESKFIKNVMETNTSATIGGAKVRLASTKALFGCDPSTLEPHEFPKFGYLSINDPKKNLVTSYELSYQYGNTVFKLNKEKLFKYTTLSVGNSVNFGRCYTLIPTLLTDPIATCISGLRHNVEDDAFHGETNMDPYYYFGMQVKEKVLTKENFFNMPDLLPTYPLYEFFELQFHCPLNIFEVVDQVDLLRDEHDDQAKLDEIAKIFAEHSVPFNIHDTLF